jgi:hypothetical protein
VRVLLLNQTFYPDVASSAQHLSEVALGLVQRGHEVTVLSSRRAYDAPPLVFSKHETWQGVRIVRLGGTGFGKGARWRRAADFVSFLIACALRLAFTRRPDVVVALTSPPLIAFLGVCFARVRRCRFVYWIMDLNPDEALAAGWLRTGSWAARWLEAMSRFSLRRADKVIALDRFMLDRVASKGARRISVIPPWSHSGEVRFDRSGRERFRQAHGLEGKFVVMYSGNHSPCHPLDTLLEVARRSAEVPEVVFCFVGGGSEWRKIREGITKEVMPNVLCLPYQRLSELSGSLSAADLHVVVMGNEFVGIVHPCKVYNILQVGAPVLYIGPQPSHVSDLEQGTAGEARWFSACHGEVEKVIAAIEQARKEAVLNKRHVSAVFRSAFSREAVVPKLIAEVEGVALERET